MKLNNKTTSQFIKFSIIGTVGTTIHLAILYSLTEFAGVYYIISAIVAFLIALTNNFLMNKFWTFRETSKGKHIKRYITFIIVATIAFLVNIAILYTATEFLNIHYLLSQIIAIAASLWINFFGSKRWAFKYHKIPEEIIT